MAGQDIPMTDFPVETSADYVYVQKGSNQAKMQRIDAMLQFGTYKNTFYLKKEEQVELPFKSGLIIVQVDSITFEKAMALVQGNNSGRVIREVSTVSFFVDTPSVISILNQGNNTNYIIKNNRSSDTVISIIFI